MKARVSLSNARQPGETFPAYRARLRLLTRGVKRYLSLGVPARCTREGEAYVAGEHPTHAPKVIKQPVINYTNGHVTDIGVNHPGTLVKRAPSH